MTKGFVFAFVCFGLVASHFRYHLAAVICDLKPSGANGSPSANGNKYRIVVATNPETYVPGQTYNVILQGKNSVVQEPNQFNGFALTVEPVVDKSEESIAVGPLAAGLFRLLPHSSSSYAKIDEFCPNTVVHTSHTFVSSIEVLWVAPNPGIGCVRFRAAVMEQHVWYRNGGGLTLELCEMEKFESTDVPEKCCSCNEAKYEMKFEGLWTRQSHPRFYPDNSWLTRFSDVIGASHAFDYRFWKVNESASPGLVEFSEKENTTGLESEIKSNKTRTVIKAKGISHPNITGKTFAAFRVDPEHHLLSIISLIKPSPDWFVGISGLALCDDKCNWTQQKTLDLYPYDLGLYADLKYESKMMPKEEPIHKIDDFNEPESPFYTNNEDKLKPLARVYLTKAREYDRHCQTITPDENQNQDRKPNEGPPGLEEPASKSPSIPEITGFSNVPKVVNHVSDEECEIVPFKHNSTCSQPECDLDRVQITYRQFDERIRQYCTEAKIPTEKLTPCPKVCNGGKQPTSRTTLAKCAVSDWPAMFSPCDPVTCIRNRTRYITDRSKKTDPECLRVQLFQGIECPPEECPREKDKLWRRKQAARKYNVTISASYTYTAEQDSKCTNSSQN